MAAVTNYHKLGGLKQLKFVLTVLEVGSLKSTCQQGCTSSEGSSGQFVPCLIQLLLAVSVHSLMAPHSNLGQTVSSFILCVSSHLRIARDTCHWIEGLPYSPR